MDSGPLSQGSVFPADFAWGVATSSHQVEGGNSNNQWAAWEKNGRIKSRDCVGLACDWWRNAERDFDLAQALGVNALRLSVEWSRIEP
jgi:beta-glucosidase